MIPGQVLVLVAALFGSVILSLIFPEPSAAMSPYIGPMMMVLLFMSFIKLSPRDIWAQISGNPLGLLIGAVLKLIILPMAAWGLTWLVYPRLSLGAVLIGGCSTAVAAPFFVTLVGGAIPYALIMAVVTSLLMPLTLPLMIRLLSGAELSFDLAALAWFLFRLIFIPLGAAFLVRRFWPGLGLFFDRISSRLSLILITTISFSCLGRYADFLISEVEIIWTALALSSSVALLSGLTGYLAAGRKAWPDKVTAAGSLIFMNNAIPIALGVHLNDPYVIVLSAAYFMPFYAILISGAWVNARRRQAEDLSGNAEPMTANR